MTAQIDAIRAQLDSIIVTAAAAKTALAALTPPPPPPPPPVSVDGVQAASVLSWGPIIGGDEFAYTGPPDPNRWGLYDGPGHNGNGRRTPAAFTVFEGLLTNHGDAAGNTGGMAYYGPAGSTTTYRDEVRMRIVAGSGSGATYHAVLIRWPDSDMWPRGGEDDFAETDVGAAGMQAFIHWPNQDSGSVQSTASATLDIAVWHNYAIERTARSVTGWIDGVQWFRFTDPHVLGLPGPMHPTVQLDALDSGTHRPADQQIAWYRIYAPS